MFEKGIILEEQLAVRCLLQCSPARKLPAYAGTGYKGKDTPEISEQSAMR
jgi:hypothetical protein